MSNPKKVFISYSHDSTQHSEFVRQLSDQLRVDGLDCQIDQYVNGFPPEGWQRWMENQLEAAEYVLLVCTENYLKRYRGQETLGGKGVNFEGIVISQHLYDAYYHNTKFIPVIPDIGSFEHVPIALRGFNTYTLQRDYAALYRYLTQQPEHIAPSLGQVKVMHTSTLNKPVLANVRSSVNTATFKLHSDRLPTVKGEFFGREMELKLLNKAWSGTKTRIIQFIAAGGTGKTKLLRHWLDNTSNLDILLAWSFYSQGSSEDKQTSASPFFTHIFEKLGATRQTFPSEEARGEYLAELLRDKRYVLVLDGLEPLQHAGRGMRGELKDRALRQLLKSIAKHPQGLCIITTRIAVFELQDRPYVIAHKLNNLEPNDGVKLLKSLQVQGTDTELTKAVQEYNCHALALHLLGNALRTYLSGDVRRRDTLGELIDEYDADSRHAAKVMQAYSYWLADTPELKLLQILELFDHPLELDVLEVLWEAQIPNLTKDIPNKAWKVAIRDLREQHHLLSEHQDSVEVFDCHPLIREYFGRQLKKHQPEAWQQAHEYLYEYYKATPEKEFPDTLEEMQPLFKAITHGCKAELHELVYQDVYWSRIAAKESYIWYHLGGYVDDLSTLANFFDCLWNVPSQNLSKYSQATVANRASFCLGMLGRDEAEALMQLTIDNYTNEGDSEGAITSISNLALFYVDLGKINKASKLLESYFNCLEVNPTLIGYLTYYFTLAYIAHQRGLFSLADTLFKKVEDTQKSQKGFPYLYAAQGYFYLDLLIDTSEKKLDILFNRAYFGLETLDTAELGDFSKSLYFLALGRLYRKRNKFKKSLDKLHLGLTHMEQSNFKAYTSRFHLEIANTYSHALNPKQNINRTYDHLETVYETSKNYNLRLIESDYHLEMARLLIAEQKLNEANEHTIKAAKLIEDTGYHRRDVELADLQTQLAIH